MITGDNTLTACQVAKDLKFVNKPILTFTPNGNWINLEESQSFQPKNNSELEKLATTYDFCITGDGLTKFLAMYSPTSLVHVRIYARTSPQQKETILLSLKKIGRTTLMCGDGTNDVGALKQAHVGTKKEKEKLS